MDLKDCPRPEDSEEDKKLYFRAAFRRWIIIKHRSFPLFLFLSYMWDNVSIERFEYVVNGILQEEQVGV